MPEEPADGDFIMTTADAEGRETSRVVVTRAERERAHAEGSCGAFCSYCYQDGCDYLADPGLSVYERLRLSDPLEDRQTVRENERVVQQKERLAGMYFIGKPEFVGELPLRSDVPLHLSNSGPSEAFAATYEIHRATMVRFDEQGRRVPMDPLPSPPVDEE